MLYVMSDLHGHFEEFKEMLEKINFTDTDTLVVLGDVIDRGPDPIPLLTYILNQRNIFLLKGNHEDMMLTWNKTLDNNDLNLWYENGGYSTYHQLHELENKNIFEYKNLMRQVNDLPNYLVIDKYIFVHAGYNGYNLDDYMEDNELTEVNPEVYLNTLDQEELLWSRDEFYETKGIPNYTTIFGHTPVRSIRQDMNEKTSNDIWYDKRYNDKIGIDGGAGRGRNIICYCIDTDTAFYTACKLS